MRVALIGPVPPYRGGISHYTYALYRELQARDLDVLLVSFKQQYPRWLYPGESDRNPGQNNQQIAEAHYWLDSLNPITWLRTFRRIRKFMPDIIILPWWTPFWAPVWIVLGILNRLWLKAALVYHCHNVLPHESKRWHRWVTKTVLQLGHRYVVATQAQAEELLLLIPLANVRIAPLPINALLAEKPVDRDTARKALGLPSDDQVILFFGIVRAYKGLHVLLDAMPEIRKVLPKARLLIAGEFWEAQQDYLQQIADLGLGDCVEIHAGYVPDEKVPEYFGAADVLAAPYLSVTGSAVANMATPFGLPVVTTWEIPEAGPSVYQAEAGDAISLAKALICALNAVIVGPRYNQAMGSHRDATWIALGDALLEDI